MAEETGADVNPRRAPGGGVEEETLPFEHDTGADWAPRGKSFQLRVGPGGEVRLPPEALEALHLAPGRLSVAVLQADGLIFLTVAESLRRIRAGVPQWKPGEPLWSEELIAERRAEAAREDAEG